MTLKVHHLGVSQSERVIWLCEELGLDYELVVHNRAPVFSPPELKALHPMGQAPVIQDGSFTLAESAACVEYICQKYGNGRFIVKPTESNYAEYLYWFHFANSNLQSTIMRNFTLQNAGLAPEHPVMARLLEAQGKILRLVDEQLSKHAYLAGDEFTAADIMSVVSLTGMRCFYAYSLEGYDNILAYLQRIKAREGYQSAMKKGDPDQDIEKLCGAEAPPMHKGLAAARAAAQKK